MIFRPIITNKKHEPPPLNGTNMAVASRRDPGDLINECSRHRRARHPISGQNLPTTGKGTIMHRTPTGPGCGVLTASGYRTESALNRLGISY